MNLRIAALAALALATLTTAAEAKRTHYRATPQAEYAYQYQYPTNMDVRYASYGPIQQDIRISRKQVKHKSRNTSQNNVLDKGIRRATSSRAYKRLTRKLVDKTVGKKPESPERFAQVHTSNGLTATVIASAKDKFQGFIDAVEAAGYKIGDLGCKSWGHMRNSKHHWGGACDFDQKRRSVTAKFMYHVTEIAHRFGLTDGCTWHPRDCGHIEVPGPNSPSHNQYAMR